MLGSQTQLPAPPGAPRLAELPFRRRPLFELLGFELGREVLDLSYTGFGWAEPPRITLESAPGATGQVHVQVIEEPLLLALHSADDAPPLAGDILLELVLGDDYSVATPLSRFLAEWLPRLPAHKPVVLALCNPHRAALAGLPVGRALWYGLGDVDSWLDATDEPLRGAEEERAGGRFRLTAEAWRRA
jgi:hypothetical protein